MRIDSPTETERAAVRRALLVAADELGVDLDEPLAGALFVARAIIVVHDLIDELVRADRKRHRLTYREIGSAFGMTMQSAHVRFRDPRL